MVEVRSESQQLVALIEATVKTIFSKAETKKGWKVATSMFWGIDCTLCEQTKDKHIKETLTSTKKHQVYLEFARQDADNSRSPWMLKNRLELEGILGLWVWSLKSDPAIEIEDPVTGLKRSTASDIQARRIVPTDQAIKLDLGIWLGDDTNNITEYDLYSVSTNSMTKYALSLYQSTLETRVQYCVGKDGEERCEIRREISVSFVARQPTTGSFLWLESYTLIAESGLYGI